MPGVSTSTSCAWSVVRMPRIAFRVVSGRDEAMATCLPISALISVDLPTFGRADHRYESGTVRHGWDSCVVSVGQFGVMPLLRVRFGHCFSTVAVHLVIGRTAPSFALRGRRTRRPVRRCEAQSSSAAGPCDPCGRLHDDGGHLLASACRVDGGEAQAARHRAGADDRDAAQQLGEQAVHGVDVVLVDVDLEDLLKGRRWESAPASSTCVRRSSRARNAGCGRARLQVRRRSARWCPRW